MASWSEPCELTKCKKASALWSFHRSPTKVDKLCLSGHVCEGAGYINNLASLGFFSWDILHSMGYRYAITFLASPNWVFKSFHIFSSEYWKNERKTVLLVHGFNSYPTKWYNQELIDAFLDFEVCTGNNLLFFIMKMSRLPFLSKWHKLDHT